MVDFGWWAFIVVMGLCAGSVLTVIVHRLPAIIQQSDKIPYNLWWPRSHCPNCNTLVRWFDNLPVLSWLQLRGRCRVCRRAIGWRYPLTELGSLLITLAVVWRFPIGELMFTALLFSWILIALAIIDFRHFLLPDALTLPLLWLGLVGNAGRIFPVLTLEQAVMGAVIGYLTLYLLSHGYELLRGEKAMGLGDAKLLAALGAWTGWESLPQLLLVASLTGLAGILLARMLYKRPLNARIPFGPSLTVAGWLVFIGQNT